MFSTNSKPKVLYCGDQVVNDHGTIELIRVKELKISHLSEPYDLIITDTPDVELLLNQPYWIRAKWILVDEDPMHDYYQQAVQSELNGVRPTVSIFTPVKEVKVSEFYCTVQSVRDQTMNDFDWVILDDGECSSEFIKRLSLEVDPRIRYIRLNSISNGNIGLVKQSACSLCRGDILVELDHDDLLMSTALEEVVGAFESNPEVGFVYSDCVEYDATKGRSKEYGDGLAFGFSHHYDYLNFRPYTVAPVNPLTIRHITSVPNHVRAWRWEVYHEIGGHNPYFRIADDYELIVRTFLATKMMYIPKMLYIQKFNGNNTQLKNLVDIQSRVDEVVRHYNPFITRRFESLGIKDLCEDMTASEAVKSVNLNELQSCNLVYEKVNISK